MKFSTTALGLVLGLSATSASAQSGNYGPMTQTPQPTGPQQPAAAQAPAAEPAAPQAKPSSKALKAIADLQNAVLKGDYANVPAKVAAAQAVASNKDDHYLIASFELRAAIAQKNNTAATAAIDAMAATGVLDGARTAELYQSLGVEFYNAKDYPHAAALFQKAATLNPNSAEPYKLLAEAQNAQGQGAQGAASLSRALQIAAASGQKPGEDLYKRAVGMAYDAKSPTAIELGKQWISAYPSADSWKNTIAIYRNMYHPGVGSTLDLLRLQRAAGALISAGDYSLYATAAADQGNFGEAQAVIDQGLAAKVVDPSNPLFRDTIAGLKSKPKATAADLAAATKMAPTGKSLIGIGDRYYGLGEYAKAVESYKAAVAKGGDADLANLHIGMALARAGDKAGATAALNSVKGANADIAKFWLLYVQRS
jgi:tetratricopeptide (TPR) repeat protein